MTKQITFMSHIIEYENLAKTNEELFEDYRQTFESFLASGWYVLGKGVADFEQNFADYCGTKYCVGVASGLDALVLAIKSLNLPENSEIIVPANTYIATVLAILQAGHKPVLVEPCIDTYNLNPVEILKYLTTKTKAVLCVHLYGRPCEMDAILSICKEHSLHLLEDVAQAHGAKYRGQVVGSFGIGCHSFYPTKNLGALGDGGAVTLNDNVLNESLKSLRNYGSRVKYKNEVVGYNSRLDEIQALLLSKKLKILDRINAKKRFLANIYTENIHDRFIKPRTDPDYHNVHHIYNIRCKDRDNLRNYLIEHGVKTEIHYPIPPHKQSALKQFNDLSLPITEEIHKTTLSLPVAYYHSEDDIYRVVELLNNWKG
jgi:dTDP-4-amino-4,6-dideoxygalactose transaminase